MSKNNHIRSVADILTDPATFASSVIVLLIDNFGTECLGWEPETVDTEIEETFKIRVTPQLSDKINAASSLLNSDLYHKSLEGFNAVNTAFSFKPVSSGEFNFATLDDTMWGCTEARLLEGADVFDISGFSHDIAHYVGELLSVEGITRPPSILSFAEFDPGELDRVTLTISGDPELAAMYDQRQIQEVAQLEQLAMNRLKNLFKELESLPLKNGQAELPDAIKAAIYKAEKQLEDRHKLQ